MQTLDDVCNLVNADRLRELSPEILNRMYCILMGWTNLKQVDTNTMLGSHPTISTVRGQAVAPAPATDSKQCFDIMADLLETIHFIHDDASRYERRFQSNQSTLRCIMTIKIIRVLMESKLKSGELKWTNESGFYRSL